MTMHDIIHPLSIILCSILDPYPPFNSLIIVPESFIDFTISTRMRISPEELSVAISLIVPQTADVYSFPTYPETVFVSESALAAHHTILEISRVVIWVAKSSRSVTIKFSTEKEPTFACIVLETIIIFIN